jgi:methyl coenzyme M reductase beta subunit
MDLSSGDISALIFKPVVRDDLGNFSLDGHMLSVLMALDGKKTLGQIAQQANLNMATIREAVGKLLDLKLIEIVVIATQLLDHDFISYLISEMSIAIGPLGEVIVEDGLEDLGFNKATFPTHRVAELVNLLAQEIQRDEKRAEFKQRMVKKIREKGY